MLSPFGMLTQIPVDVLFLLFQGDLSFRQWQEQPESSMDKLVYVYLD